MNMTHLTQKQGDRQRTPRSPWGLPPRSPPKEPKAPPPKEKSSDSAKIVGMVELLTGSLSRNLLLSFLVTVGLYLLGVISLALLLIHLDPLSLP